MNCRAMKNTAVLVPINFMTLNRRFKENSILFNEKRLFSIAHMLFVLYKCCINKSMSFISYDVICLCGSLFFLLFPHYMADGKSEQM